MAEISAKDVKALREATGAGMMDCKKALAEANGDVEAAKRLLREKGLADAAKRRGRAASEGIVYAYLHQPQPDYPPKLGVLLELNCETDFVAKTEQFERLAKDIAMHISFADPSWTVREEVPRSVIDEESAVRSSPTPTGRIPASRSRSSKRSCRGSSSPSTKRTS